MQILNIINHHQEINLRRSRLFFLCRLSDFVQSKYTIHDKTRNMYLLLGHAQNSLFQWPTLFLFKDDRFFNWMENVLNMKIRLWPKVLGKYWAVWELFFKDFNTHTHTSTGWRPFWLGFLNWRLHVSVSLGRGGRRQERTFLARSPSSPSATGLMAKRRPFCTTARETLQVLF